LVVWDAFGDAALLIAAGGVDGFAEVFPGVGRGFGVRVDLFAGFASVGFALADGACGFRVLGFAVLATVNADGSGLGDFDFLAIPLSIFNSSFDPSREIVGTGSRTSSSMLRLARTKIGRNDPCPRGGGHGLRVGGAGFRVPG
jgi:hypothetical protein